MRSRTMTMMETTTTSEAAITRTERLPNFNSYQNI